MKTKLPKRTSANDLYNHYTVRESIIKYQYGFNLTEGINEIAIYENCFMILDIICRHKKNFEVEIWQFSRTIQNIFTLTGTNKFGIQFVVIYKIESDFYFDDLTILKKGKLICLPIEDNLY